jgi:hypothetical protein
MIAAGVNAKALSTFMGHANILITLDRYGHLMPGSERRQPLNDPQTPSPQAKEARQEADADHRRVGPSSARIGGSMRIWVRLSPVVSG